MNQTVMLAAAVRFAMDKLYTWQAQYLEGLPDNVIMTADTGTGKTIMAMTHAMPDLPILVIAPPAKVNSQDWQQIAIDFQRQMAVVSFGKVAKFPSPLNKPYILIVDEIHYAKNATAQRAKAVIRLAKDSNCKQVIGLSATAIPNGFIDLQTYGIIFGWWKNKTEFIRRYVLIDRSRGYPRIIGYVKELELKERWQSVAFGLDKSHLHLPDLINITTTINLSPKQRNDYLTIKNTRMLGDELLDTPSKLHATLRQYLSTTRIQALEAVLDDTDEHILVFYSYNVSRQAILATAAKYKREVYEQSGHASNLPDGVPTEPSITLLQYQSGSVGLNLQYASISIFYEPSYSWMDTEQAKGRNYRGGQTKMVRHFWFKVDRTIDTAVYKCLERKEDFNENILDSDDVV